MVGGSHRAAGGTGRWGTRKRAAAVGPALQGLFCGPRHCGHGGGRSWAQARALLPAPAPPQLAGGPPNAVGSRHRLPGAKLAASGLQPEMARMLVGVWQGRPGGQVSRLLPREEAGAALSVVSRTDRVSPCACPWDLLTSSHRGAGGAHRSARLGGWGTNAPPSLVSDVHAVGGGCYHPLLLEGAASEPSAGWRRCSQAWRTAGPQGGWPTPLPAKPKEDVLPRKAPSLSRPRVRWSPLLPVSSSRFHPREACPFTDTDTETQAGGLGLRHLHPGQGLWPALPASEWRALCLCCLLPGPVSLLEAPGRAGPTTIRYCIPRAMRSLEALSRGSISERKGGREGGRK